MTSIYQIQADWDPEAEVWVATSEDVPGLVTEAESIEDLTRKLRIMIPEMLEANGILPRTEDGKISFELRSRLLESIPLAS